MYLLKLGKSWRTTTMELTLSCSREDKDVWKIQAVSGESPQPSSGSEVMSGVLWFGLQEIAVSLEGMDFVHRKKR